MGTDGSTGYIGKFYYGNLKKIYYLDFINIHQDFTTFSILMTPQTTAFTMITGTASLGSPAGYTASNTITQTSTDATYTSIAEWETNIYPVFTSQVISGLLPNSTFNRTVDITCSTINSTITLTTASYNSEPIPTWVTIDSNTGEFTGTTPVVDAETNYTFYLNADWSTFPSGTTQQLITLTVAPEADDGVTDVQADLITSTQVASIGGIVIAAGIALLTMSPPYGVWAIMHQLQMILLILMACSEIPEPILSYMQGQSFSLVNLSTIPSIELPGIEIPVDWMDFEQPIDILAELDIQSRSTFVNHVTFILTVLYMIAAHVLLSTLNCIKTTPDASRLKKLICWIKKKILDIIIYAMYVRTFIEEHEILIITSTSEIYQFDNSSASSNFSLFIAFCALAI